MNGSNDTTSKPTGETEKGYGSSGRLPYPVDPLAQNDLGAALRLRAKACRGTLRRSVRCMGRLRNKAIPRR